MATDQAAIVRRAAERRGAGSPLALVAVVVAAAIVGVALRGRLDRPALQTWATLFVAVTVQAVPFLVLGVAVSALIAAFVPSAFFARILPRHPALAVPAAACAGVILPGCECGSVPIAGRLIDRGVPAPAALTFLLAAPAVNPVVTVATVIAFPGRPEMAVARVVASLIAAIAVGWAWTRWGDADLAIPTNHHEHRGSRLDVLLATARHDFLHAGGFLVVGAAAAAFLQTAVPRSVLDSLAGGWLVPIACLAVLAVVMAVCSEADAFVAASLAGFPMTARLVFLVVGPMVDVKLIALQAGTFGRRFALRFAPLTFAAAVMSAIAVGTWLL